jgi:DNA polymerase-3 subunit alpha
MPASITDHGNLFGAVEFYRLMTKAGIKPIIGCEVYVAPGSRLEKKQSPDGEGASFHLILLARDNNGYRNLITLVTKAYTEGFYYRPRIDMNLLEQYSGGLIALTSCLKGEILIISGMMDRARTRPRIQAPARTGQFHRTAGERSSEQAELNKNSLNLRRTCVSGSPPMTALYEEGRRESARYPQCIQTANR